MKEDVEFIRFFSVIILTLVFNINQKGKLDKKKKYILGGRKIQN